MATRVYGWEQEDGLADGQSNAFNRMVVVDGKLSLLIYGGGTVTFPSPSFVKRFPSLVRSKKVVLLKKIKKELDTPKC